MEEEIDMLRILQMLIVCKDNRMHIYFTKLQ